MHDYLVTHADYDITYTYYNPDGVLLHGIGTCQSYALAYQLLLREMGIPCIFIVGEAGGVDHSWNLVRIDGQWYHVDCTYDDPVGGNPIHCYFLTSDDGMINDHTWNTALYPACGQAMPLVDFEFASEDEFSRKMTSFYTDYIPQGEWGAPIKFTLHYTGDYEDFSQDYLLIYYSNWKKNINTELYESISGSNTYIYTLANGNFIISINEDVPELPPDTLLMTYGDFEYQICTDGIRIVHYVGEDRHVTIPDYINGYPVTTLGFLSFTDCTFLESVQLPETLTSIEDGVYGFPDYKPLSAFGDCTALTSVVIPGSVKRIGNLAFCRCSSLSRVTLCEGIEEIGLDSFGKCPITSIQLPHSTVLIEQNSFYRTNITSVTIPANVSNLHPLAFYECQLTEINVDSNNPYYDSDDGVLFAEGYEHLLAYPMNRPVDWYAIPETCMSVYYYAFERECQIRGLILPDAFDVITYISELPMSLEYIQVSESNPYYSSVDGVLFSKDLKSLLIYPCSRPDAAYAVPAGTENIRAIAFRNSMYLRKLTIPSSVVAIGDDVCIYSQSLESVVFEEPSSVTSIPESAFQTCLHLSEVVLPDHLQTIGFNAFFECPIQHINLPDTITEIGQQAFCSNMALVSVTIPESVQVLSLRSFAACPSLRYVRINGSIGLASLEAFADCSEDLTIVGTTGSFAESYAQQANIHFILESNIEQCYDLSLLDDAVLEFEIADYFMEGRYHQTFYTLTIKGAAEGHDLVLCEREHFYISDRSKPDEYDNKVYLEITGCTPWHGTHIFTVSEEVNWPSAVGRRLIYLLNGMQAKVVDATNITTLNYSEGTADGTRVNPNLFQMDETGYIRTSATETGMDHICANYRDFSIVCAVCVIDAQHALKLPQNLRIIDNQAFINTGFEAIVLPASVSSVKWNAFSSCNNLKLIVVHSRTLDLTGLRVPYDVTIACYPGSSAEQFCIANQQPYVYLVDD